MPRPEVAKDKDASIVGKPMHIARPIFVEPAAAHRCGEVSQPRLRFEPDTVAGIPQPERKLCFLVECCADT